MSNNEMVLVPRADIELLVGCQRDTYVAPEGESCLRTGMKVHAAAARLEKVLAEPAALPQGEPVAFMGFDPGSPGGDFGCEVEGALLPDGRLRIDKITNIKPAEEPASIRDVVAERQRQVTVEGWTPEGDDRSQGKLGAAAACYLLFSDDYPNAGHPPPMWPWAAEWWKPKDYRRDLIRAGALVLAEIERIDRASELPQ